LTRLSAPVGEILRVMEAKRAPAAEAAASTLPGRVEFGTGVLHASATEARR
jgi:hypothetical protein